MVAVVPLPWVKVGVKVFWFAPVAPANVKLITPLPWLLVALFGWHSMQAMGLNTPPVGCVAPATDGVGFTWAACTPTRTLAEAPWASTGGAAAWLAS